jgi:hypothetical protein
MGLVDCPRARQGVVDRGNLIVQNIPIVLVEIKSFLGESLIVGVQWRTARFELAQPFEIPGLDLDHIIATIPVFIDPSAEGITVET